MPATVPPKEEWFSFVRAVEVFSITGLTDDRLIELGKIYWNLPDRRVKYRARLLLKEYVSKAIAEDNLDKARTCEVMAAELFTPAGYNKPPPKNVQLESFLQLAESIQLAFGLVATNPPKHLRSELSENWLDELRTDITPAVEYRNWMMQDPATRPAEPRTLEVYRKAARISLGRSPNRTYKTQKAAKA